MPSPFPGMDPFIEASNRWGDFHLNMLGAFRGELNAMLPRGFAASTEEYLWILEGKAKGRKRRVDPDAFVVAKGKWKESAMAVAPAAPATIVLPVVQRRKRRYLQIVDLESNQVVTVIELLSPSNKKAGKDREAYLAKRGEYLAGPVSLVEIDLLRQGTRLSLGDPPPPSSDYYVLVCRSWEAPRASLWSFNMRDPLPEIPIPLVENVPDVFLSLRTCLDRVYEGGRYDFMLRYDRPLKPRLGKRDAAWVREVLAARSDEAS